MTPPTPEEIRAARQSAHLTQTQAAELIYKQRLAWARYESGDREMDPALWELFQIKLKASQRHSGVYPLSKAPAGENDL